MKDMEEDKLLEDASNLCHKEWVDWSNNISKELNEVVKVLNDNIKYLKEEDFDEETKNLLLEENIVLRDKISLKLEKWASLSVPYDELSEEMKEKDRIYARKILELVE